MILTVMLVKSGPSLPHREFFRTQTCTGGHQSASGHRAYKFIEKTGLALEVCNQISTRAVSVDCESSLLRASFLESLRGTGRTCVSLVHVLGPGHAHRGYPGGKGLTRQYSPCTPLQKSSARIEDLLRYTGLLRKSASASNSLTGTSLLISRY